MIAKIHDPKNVYGLLNDQGFDPVYGLLNRVMIDELTRGLCRRQEIEILRPFWCVSDAIKRGGSQRMKFWHHASRA